ncbi:hypothetical protein [Uliginosibacterium gangwonense]|uniref:hypothetical protein n=1 Tax=Uliginosibacterium gangwonense TaxID=392736 RepID=UPI000373521B|nr:hypothetical protein [Uliginosibacterium gangwonense]
MESHLRGQLWHASGGLVYHGRAWRYRNTLWAPFLQQVESWLEAWAPRPKQLLIVGPSAGYTLPAQWLSRFARIDILEPDPLARWLLEQRFPDCVFHAGDLDCFALDEGPMQLAHAYPHSAILFSNVIGQIFEGGPTPIWRAALQMAMRGRCWASYHDIASCHILPARRQVVTLPACSRLEDILPHFWDGREIAVYDHGCLDLADAQCAYGMWSITPRQHHIVGWCSNTEG